MPTERAPPIYFNDVCEGALKKSGSDETRNGKNSDDGELLDFST